MTSCLNVLDTVLPQTRDEFSRVQKVKHICSKVVDAVNGLNYLHVANLNRASYTSTDKGIRYHMPVV